MPGAFSDPLAWPAGIRGTGSCGRLASWWRAAGPGRRRCADASHDGHAYSNGYYPRRVIPVTSHARPRALQYKATMTRTKARCSAAL